MAWALHFLVWITVVTTSTAYEYPIRTHQIQYTGYPLDGNNPGYGRPAPVYDRLNPRSPDEVTVYQPRPEELVRRSENGSTKILNNFFRRKGQIDRNQIIFPGPTATISREFEPEIPDSCKTSTLCEDVTNYPQDAIDKLISEIPNLKQFQLDRLDIPDTPDITQRLGPTEENIELCNSHETVTYPKAAKDADDKWVTLLNRKDNPIQGFKVEVCEQADSPCSDIAVFITGYVARCKQKYFLRMATTVMENADGSLTTVEKPVKIPSCCSCVAKANIT